MPFQKEYREPLRRISCETAFLEVPRERIFTDDEILADALTIYFTDYEPQSCSVAVSGNNVIGYITGSKDVCIMNKIFNSKIIFPLLIKAIRKQIFFKKTNLRFFFYLLRSVLLGEYSMPNLSHDFPATLHINLSKDYRGQGLGKALINHYLNYLRQNKIQGVHFGTFSEKAKDFFIKTGFQVLFSSKRTYLKPYTGKEINFYIFGMRL